MYTRLFTRYRIGMRISNKQIFYQINKSFINNLLQNSSILITPSYLSYTLLIISLSSMYTYGYTGNLRPLSNVKYYYQSYSTY